MREREFIQFIAGKCAGKHPHLRKGIGDDCAVFGNIPGKDWLVTTDMLVAGVHFDTSWHDPYLLGRKSLAVNLSDIAAMAGTPQFVLLSIAVPGEYDTSWIETYMAGFFSMLEEHNCVLIGGDTVSSEKLTLSVTVIGTATAGRAIGRDGARAGDAIYVSGPLGSAAAGLHLCQAGRFTVTDTRGCKWQELLSRHLDPSPRLQLAQLLLNCGCVTAMQDISDGIATDLSHICTASRVAATIEEEALPAHGELLSMCGEMDRDPLHFQLRGGEDYELLFTVQSGREEELERLVASGGTGDKIYRIGRVGKGQGVTLLTRSAERVAIDYQGYEHST